VICLNMLPLLQKSTISVPSVIITWFNGLIRSKFMSNSSLTGMKFVDKGDGKYECVIYKGISINQVFVLKNKDSGEPIDVTGYSAQFKVATALENGTELLNLTDQSGITVGTTDGKFTLQLSYTDSQAIEAGQKGFYAFTVTKPSGQKQLIQSGKAKIVDEVP
jgi:hypothetical protein